MASDGNNRTTDHQPPIASAPLLNDDPEALQTTLGFTSFGSTHRGLQNPKTERQTLLGTADADELPAEEEMRSTVLAGGLVLKAGAAPGFKERPYVARPPKKERAPNLPPTHFLSVRLSDPSLRSTFQSFYESARQRFPRDAGSLVDPRTAHVTLFVFALARESASPQGSGALKSVGEARSCLEECQELIRSHFPQRGPLLTFKGVGTFFQNRVLYARPVADAETAKLAELVGSLRSRFSSSGIFPKDDHDGYTPHATLAKMRSGAGRGAGWGGAAGGLPREMWSEYDDFDWGSQQCDAVELLSMVDPKGADGFYKVEGRVEF